MSVKGSGLGRSKKRIRLKPLHSKISVIRYNLNSTGQRRKGPSDEIGYCAEDPVRVFEDLSRRGFEVTNVGGYDLYDLNSENRSPYGIEINPVSPMLGVRSRLRDLEYSEIPEEAIRRDDFSDLVLREMIDRIERDTKAHKFFGRKGILIEIKKEHLLTTLRRMRKEKFG